MEPLASQLWEEQAVPSRIEASDHTVLRFNLCVGPATIPKGADIVPVFFGLFARKCKPPCFCWGFAEWRFRLFWQA